MSKSTVVTFFQAISSIGSVVGIVFFFINPIITILCGVLSLLSSIINVTYGDQNNLSTEISTIIIASVVALFTNLNWLEFSTFLLCTAEIIVLIVGWLTNAFVSRKVNQYKNNDSFTQLYETHPLGKEIEKIDNTAMELQKSYHKAMAILDNYSEELILEMYNRGEINDKEKEEYLYHVETAEAFVATIPQKIKELQHQRFELLNQDKT